MEPIAITVRFRRTKRLSTASPKTGIGDFERGEQRVVIWKRVAYLWRIHLLHTRALIDVVDLE